MYEEADNVSLVCRLEITHYGFANIFEVTYSVATGVLARKVNNIILTNAKRLSGTYQAISTCLDCSIIKILNVKLFLYYNGKHTFESP